MGDFKREMEGKKEEWREKMKKLDREIIKWEWTDNSGNKYNGSYSGEVKDKQPHGVGRWTSDDGKETVEGEWKDGKENGKAVWNRWDGDLHEYEATDGKYNGKLITYLNDDRRV